MSGCDSLSKFTVRCVFLEYIHGWVWVGVTVKSTFMGECTYFEYIYELVWVFVTA